MKSFIIVEKLLTSPAVLSRFSSTSCSDGPLTGFRVLDLTRILAGPFCSMILGDLGAEIIKVERPESGDETRRWGPPFLPNNESCYFLCVNRNKKSLTVNLKTNQGQKIIRKLAEKSDVFLENYVPGSLDRLGLGYESLRKVNPKLIYCSITGYGCTGPYASRAGYDVIAASLGGLLHITGPKQGDPCKVGVAMTDLATGLYAHGAVMAALLQRSKSNVGQKIDCNLLSTQVSMLVNLASSYLNAGEDCDRWGTSHPSIVPYQAFRTTDGYITVGAGSDSQFKILCKILEEEHLISNPCYLTNKERVANREELVSFLQQKFETRSTTSWLEVFEGSGIPYAPINSLAQVFADPQVQHNKMVIEMQHSSEGTVKLLGPAVTFGTSKNRAYLPPPLLGQQTHEILSEILKMSEKEIEELRSLNVL